MYVHFFFLKTYFEKNKNLPTYCKDVGRKVDKKNFKCRKLQKGYGTFGISWVERVLTTDNPSVIYHA